MSEKGLFCGINKPKDFKSITDFEKKHTPQIECPDEVRAGEPFEVKIRVGDNIAHPMEEGHFIQWIEVKSGENLYVRAEFTPVFSRPDVVVTLVKKGMHKQGTLRVIERCNLHGLWEASKEIKIIGGEPK